MSNIGKGGLGQMKHSLFAICTSFALAVTALGQNRVQNNDDVTGQGVRHKKSTVQTTAPVTTRRNVMTNRSLPRTQRSTTRVSGQQQTYVRQPRVNRINGNATVRSNTTVNGRLRERNFRETGQAGVRSDVTATRDRNFGVNRDRNIAVNRDKNLMVNRDRNFAVNHGATINRNRNVTITNNWRGRQFSGNQYAAFRNYHRTWHDRNWWTSHYNRIIFVSGGWYYWDGGYWFPAWGYAPGAYYPYDGPIYGYSNLTPDQIVANVQAQLQRDGYYAGPIDGVLGPMTREALAAFQADHGLAITSTVDEPTLDTLGLS
jgi:hypothetical protein